MHIQKSLLSVLIAAAVTGSGTAMQAFAENIAADIYDSTIYSESKEEAEVSAYGADESPYNVFDIYDAHQKYLKLNSGDSDLIYRQAEGIDVSKYQSDINWEKVAASGIDYVIVNAGYGKFADQKDPKFDENMKNAQAVGLDCGAYWYSYALSVEDAYKEAEACYQAIKDYNFTYPIYFDIEDPSQSRLSVAETSAIIEAFCTTLQKKGYYVGIYSFASLLTSKVYEEVLDKYDVWVAHFDVPAPAYARSYGMWQYSSTGRVNGISTDVDLDHCYINYPYLISPETYVPDGTETDAPPAHTLGSADKGVAKGVDVSVWQTKIDWEKVARSDIDFAIIRAGYGDLESQKDKYFDDNMAGAAEAGIACGAYWYSYASSPEDAVLEANACYEVIKDLKLEYPVYYCLEDQCLDSLSNEEITDIAEAFCSVLEKKGYYVGIKSYADFLNSRIDESIFDKYDVWVSHYGVVKPDFNRSYNMWQFTNEGNVDGINNYVNINYAYLDFPKIMKNAHLNGF